MRTERDVGMSPNVVSLSTSGHDVGPAARRAGPVSPSPITIGDGCWIGGGVSVLPGGTIVAAGALVRADRRAHAVYVGVPARKPRDLAPGEGAVARLRVRRDPGSPGRATAAS